jgi:dihydrofolate reductase
MRELVVDLFTTVDGYASGRMSPAFFGYAGAELDAWIDEQLSRPHEMLMGSNTYRTLSGIVATGSDPNAERMNALPKTVFSRSLRSPLAWPNTRLVDDDVAVAVPALKRQAGDPLRVIGSLTLVGSLLRLGLVDRLRLMLFPQILGETGREPILRSVPDINLRLAASGVLDGRLVLLEYVPQT